MIPQELQDKIRITEELSMKFILEQIHKYSVKSGDITRLNDWIFIYGIKRLMFTKKINADQVIKYIWKYIIPTKDIPLLINKLSKN